MARFSVPYAPLSPPKLPFPSFFFPESTPRSGRASGWAERFAAWSIAALVALHATGALKHHFFDWDDVLMRMLPGWPTARRPDGSKDAPGSP